MRKEATVKWKKVRTSKKSNLSHFCLTEQHHFIQATFSDKKNMQLPYSQILSLERENITGFKVDPTLKFTQPDKQNTPGRDNVLTLWELYVLSTSYKLSFSDYKNKIS